MLILPRPPARPCALSVAWLEHCLSHQLRRGEQRRHSPGHRNDDEPVLLDSSLTYKTDDWTEDQRRRGEEHNVGPGAREWQGPGAHAETPLGQDCHALNEKEGPHHRRRPCIESHNEHPRMKDRAHNKGSEETEHRVASSREREECVPMEPLAHGAIPSLAPELSRASREDRRPVNRRGGDPNDAMDESNTTIESLERRIEGHRRTNYLRDVTYRPAQSAEPPRPNKVRRTCCRAVQNDVCDHPSIKTRRHWTRATDVEGYESVPYAAPGRPRPSRSGNLSCLHERQNAHHGKYSPRNRSDQSEPRKTRRCYHKQCGGAAPHASSSCCERGCGEQDTLHGEPHKDHVRHSTLQCLTHQRRSRFRHRGSRVRGDPPSCTRAPTRP